jgi:enoyl-CoA hydratase
MVNAIEAKEIGLANHVVPQKELKQKCEEIANQILKNGPNAVAKSLECVRDGVGLSTKEGLEMEVNNFSSLFNTDETIEGLSAFVEKRVPNFRK